MAPVKLGPHHRHAVNAFEDVGALRRAVATLAAAHRDLRPGAAELIATELGTNLLKHAAPGGYVLYRQTEDGIELLSVDSGPGMRAHLAPDAARPRSDGLSAGLSTIRHMSTVHDCYSTTAGTVMMARLGGDSSGADGRWRHGAINVPLGGSGPSGDAWGVSSGARLAATVVDGLGHGENAAIAAAAAMTAFGQRGDGDPAAFLGRAHEGMRSTRGGVAGACLIDPDAGQVTFVGLGNVTGQIVYADRKRHHLLSRPGTLGTQLSVPSLHTEHQPWSPGTTLVMVSDGIRSGWDLLAYPGLLGHHPSVIAAVLHRDFTRQNDDATVLVVQEAP